MSDTVLVVVDRSLISDVGYEILLNDEVTDCVNIVCIDQFGFFKRDSLPGTKFVGGPSPTLVSGYFRKMKSASE